VALLASPRASNEDLFLAGLLVRDALPGAAVYLAVHERGEDDDILLRKDKSPNLRGAREIFSALLPCVADETAGAAGATSGAAGMPGTPAVVNDALMRAGTARLEVAIRSGRVKALIVMGSSAAGVVSGEAMPLSAEGLAGIEEIVLLDAFETPLALSASAVLPTQAFGEFEGTFTNFAGVVQRVRAALPPSADAWPAWKVLQELGRRVASVRAVPFAQFTGAQAVFAALAESVPAYSGLSYAVLGDHGRTIGPAESE